MVSLKKFEDDTQKIILNTKGIIKDLNTDLLEFLKYVENSTDEVAENSESALVKHIHKKVNAVKRDKTTEVHFLKECEAQFGSYKLLERDREKIEEGREEGKAELLVKQLERKLKEIPENYKKLIMNLQEEKIDEIGLNIFDIEKIEELDKYL